MARGGRRGGNVKRDANGRFSSTGSGPSAPKRSTPASRRTAKPKRGAPKATGGTLKARAGLARSRRRLAAADPADVTIKGTLSRRSQRGAVTRGKNALAQAKKESRVRLAIGPKKGVIRKPKGWKPGTLAERRAKGTKKVDLTDAGFTRRLARAKTKLAQAEADYKERGSSIYDKQARQRVMILRSAVDKLKLARQTVRASTVAPAAIKARLKEGQYELVSNYQRQLAVTTRNAARTAFSTKQSTAPKLTPAEKAAVTRARNKESKQREQARRWERSRRNR